MPKAGFPFRSITISGFQRKLTLKNVGRNLRTAVRVFTSSAEARKILRNLRGYLHGTGGYVSGPVIREAAKLGIPTVIHESNAYPGVTTKMLAKKVDRVMLAVADAESYFPVSRVNWTGNPVRPAVIRARREETRRALSLDERPMILSFGGSLNAVQSTKRLQICLSQRKRRTLSAYSWLWPVRYLDARPSRGKGPFSSGCRQY